MLIQMYLHKKQPPLNVRLSETVVLRRKNSNILYLRLQPFNANNPQKGLTSFLRIHTNYVKNMLYIHFFTLLSSKHIYQIPHIFNMLIRKLTFFHSPFPVAAKR